MAGTPHGTHSILVESPSDAEGIRDAFVAIVKALDALGMCTRIASFYGEGAGHGFNFSNEALPCGENAFAVYRWNANVNRTWEWYLLIQVNALGSFGGALNGAQARLKGATTAGIGVAAAVAFTAAGANANPWQRTVVNNGADTKGTGIGALSDVWVAPALGKVHVWPRSNNLGGSHVGEGGLRYKDNLVPIIPTSYVYRGTRINVIADDDCLAITLDSDDKDSLGGYVVISPYTPLSGLTPTCPLVMLNNSDTYSTVTLDVDIGSLAGNIATEGGVLSPFSNRVIIGRMTARTLDSYAGAMTVPFHQKNKQFSVFTHTEVDAAIYSYEVPSYGMVGFLDPFVRLTQLTPNNCPMQTLSRFAIGRSNKNYPRYTFPWDGVTADPFACVERAGITF